MTHEEYYANKANKYGDALRQIAKLPNASSLPAVIVDKTGLATRLSCLSDDALEILVATVMIAEDGLIAVAIAKEALKP